MQRINPDIEVVMLDIKSTHDRYKEFKDLSASEKIDRLCKIIHKTMEKFSEDKNKSKTMKIFVWREYAISDPNSIFCDNTIRTLLKNKMLQLTRTYKDICIIAGTVSTKKHFAQFKKKNIDKINKAYEHPVLQSEITLETKKNTKIDPINNINTIKGHADQVGKLKPLSGGEVIRNSCYIFHDKIYRRDKVLPFFETKEKNSQVIPHDAVFRPGKGKKASSDIKLKHNINGRAVRIGLEICLEHQSGYLFKNTSAKNIEIQIVISDSVETKQEHILPNVVYIHADSRKSEFIKTTEETRVACYRVDVLEPLFSLKGAPNIKNKEGDTALHLAVQDNREDAVSKLLESGENPFIQNHEGKSPFYISLHKGYGDLAKAIIHSQKISRDDVVYGLYDALAFNIKNKTKWSLEYISQIGIDINMQDSSGRTLLHYAVSSENTDLIDLLIKEYKADDRIQNNKGNTMIEYALKRKKADSAMCLLRHQVEKFINAFKDFPNNIQNEIDLQNVISEFDNLIVDKSDVTIKNILNIYSKFIHIKLNALEVAVANKHMEIVEVILNDDATDMISYISNEEYPIFISKLDQMLITAAENSKTELVKNLVKCKHINANQINAKFETALIVAARNGCAEVIKILRESQKVNPNKVMQITATSFSSALYLAALKGHTEAVKELLLFNDIRVNATTNDATPFYIAVQEGNAAVVNLLIRHNDINVDLLCKGRSPLFIAVDKVFVNKKHEAIAVAILNKSHHSINQGAEKNISTLVNFAITERKKDSSHFKELFKGETLNNFTPLHAAAFYGNKNLVELLIKNGANIQAIATSKDAKISVYNLAQAMGNEEIMTILQNYSAPSINDTKKL